MSDESTNAKRDEGREPPWNEIPNFHQEGRELPWNEIPNFHQEWARYHTASTIWLSAEPYKVGNSQSESEQRNSTNEILQQFIKNRQAVGTKDETGARLAARKESNVRRRAARPRSFPRLWELLGWVLPSKLRRTIYEPYRQELLEDYVVSRKQSRTPAARWWLFICYTLWTVYAVVLSILAGLSSVAGQRLMRLLPQRWRRWWLP